MEANVDINIDINDVNAFSVPAGKSEALDYFEENLTMFNYADFIEIIGSLENSVQLQLKNGAKIDIGKTEGIVNMAIFFPDKTKFIGCWSNIGDNSEFTKSMRNVPRPRMKD